MTKRIALNCSVSVTFVFETKGREHTVTSILTLPVPPDEAGNFIKACVKSDTVWECPGGVALRPIAILSEVLPT
jgi:hypothetical protein